MILYLFDISLQIQQIQQILIFFFLGGGEGEDGEVSVIQLQSLLHHE